MKLKQYTLLYSDRLPKVFSLTICIRWETVFICAIVPSKLSTTKFLHFLQAKRVGGCLPPAHHKTCLCPHLTHWKRKGVCNKTHGCLCAPAVSGSNRSCVNSAGVISSSYFNQYGSKRGTSTQISYSYFEILFFPSCVFCFQHTL